MSVSAVVRVRVFVTDAWDSVSLDLAPDTTMAELKRQALRRALQRDPDPAAYQVKFRGAPILDEQRTLLSLAARDGTPFIVLRARRVPVR